jgi:8-oxo-dGTP pyrophosphatase MutT (NUDIX family)
LVLDAGCTRVLLTLHRRGGFWCQFGGHCEPGDTTLADAAQRECREESGLADLQLLPGPVELSRHRLAPVFLPCGEHLDVRYAAVAADGSTPVVSDESRDVAWWPVTALPPGSVVELDHLVARAIAAVQLSRPA